VAVRSYTKDEALTKQEAEIMRNMRTFQLIGSMAVALLIAGCESGGGGLGWGHQAQVGDQAPDFTVKDMNGKMQQFKRLAGDYTVLAFSPSIAGQGQAAPQLQKMLAANRDHKATVLSCVDVHWMADELDPQGQCHVSNKQGLMISIADPAGNVRKLYSIDEGEWLLLLNRDREVIAREPIENADKVAAMLSDKLAELSAQRTRVSAG
jgi:peroxiredoxin